MLRTMILRSHRGSVKVMQNEITLCRLFMFIRTWPTICSPLPNTRSKQAKYLRIASRRKQKTIALSLYPSLQRPFNTFNILRYDRKSLKYDKDPFLLEDQLWATVYSKYMRELLFTDILF